MKKKDELEPMLTLLFEGQKLELRSGFVGGWLADQTNSPMGMYTGINSIDESSVALLHLLRAVIKMYVDEHNMSYKQIETVLKLSVKEALNTEMNPIADDNRTMEEHQELLLKIKRDHGRR